jgi:hypothetical protein
MRVITFSRFFPAGHPRKGEATFFMEKIWKGLNTGNRRDGEYTVWSEGQLPHLWRDQMIDKKFTPKYHTIRAGNRWKVGDFFSPRVWAGKPYSSKQIEFAPPIQIKQTIDVVIEIDAPHYTYILVPQKKKDTYIMLPAVEVARNDGLSFEDFQNWFKPYCKTREDSFKGQIIIWGDVDYSGNVVKSIEA